MENNVQKNSVDVNAAQFSAGQKKELYRIEATGAKSAAKTLLHLFLTALFIMAVFGISRFLPAAWFFETAGILGSAVYINKILKEGTFRKTYILYEDSLTVLTKYGLIEKVTSEYNLKEAQFTEKSITLNGKTEPFFPDDELKRLLNL